eukprot:scaffold64880_cov30-Phaeocystis_antarctica.AAC.1
MAAAATSRFPYRLRIRSRRSRTLLCSDGARTWTFGHDVIDCAITNAVQFSVCSGVLRVLGLARARPKAFAVSLSTL